MPISDAGSQGIHIPVMTNEVVTQLNPHPDGRYLDCTVGGGGHSLALLEAGAGQVLGIDRDSDAIATATTTLSKWSARVELAHADFRDIDKVLDSYGVSTVDGAVTDLGVSSLQFAGVGRGFSFRRDEPLDMRMDQSQGRTAADILREIPESTLADLIYKYGEERYSRRIARKIIETRQQVPLTTTGQLASLVRAVVPRRRHSRIDPATRTFQALRILVNDELDRLDDFFRSICRRLRGGASIAVITFHSLEDRIVKTVFRELNTGDNALVRVVTKRPKRPTQEEVAQNPRARSAKFRAAERLM